MASRADRYTNVAIALHWAIALLLVGQVAGGFIMGNLPKGDPLKFTAFQMHKSFGMLILALTILRLLWRLGHRAPPLPANMPAWQSASARLVQAGLYGLMIALPLLGWAFVSTTTFQVPTFLFGVIPLPHLPLGVDKDRAEQFAELHELGAFALIGLFVLHAGAALFHHFVKRDGVLASMLPGGGSKTA